MELTFDATFDGEVFRPDEKVNLKPDTKVKLKLTVKKSDKKKTPYAFLDCALSIDLDTPPDFSKNIDDYLYGGKSLDEE